MFNFKKEKEPEEIKKKAVIAVWGSPNSGKTTVATKLAKAISEQKINTTLILCDNVVPMLPCILPPSSIVNEEEKSLGKLLSKVNITPTLVKENLMLIKGNPNLSILSYLKSENEYSHSSYTDIQAEELLDSVKELASVVIVDCSSNIASSVISTTALLESDFVVNLITCDLKSISFLSSQLSVLYNKGFDEIAMYKVLSNVKPNSNKEQMSMSVGKIAFEFSNSSELEEQFQEGDLLGDLTFKNSREFRKTIKLILKEILDI
ncbi:MAG: ParA family protein [Clostridia bacterium]